MPPAPPFPTHKLSIFHMLLAHQCIPAFSLEALGSSGFWLVCSCLPNSPLPWQGQLPPRARPLTVMPTMAGGGEGPQHTPCASLHLLCLSSVLLTQSSLLLMSALLSIDLLLYFFFLLLAGSVEGWLDFRIGFFSARETDLPAHAK